jgi:hypothetical protein
MMRPARLETPSSLKAPIVVGPAMAQQARNLELKFGRGDWLTGEVQQQKPSQHDPVSWPRLHISRGLLCLEISAATCIIPFAFAWMIYEGAELHPLVLPIQRPFRVEWNAIPDLLSWASDSNNTRRRARSP